MTQVIWWAVGILVAILIAMFGFFAGVAASQRSSPEQPTSASIHL